MFAGNTWLISPEQMVIDGLLAPEDIRDPPAFPKDRVDYQAVMDYKNNLFNRAFERFKEWGPDFRYKEFVAENVSWLDDYAIFVTLKERFGGRSGATGRPISGTGTRVPCIPTGQNLRTGSRERSSSSMCLTASGGVEEPLPLKAPPDHRRSPGLPHLRQR